MIYRCFYRSLPCSCCLGLSCNLSRCVVSWAQTTAVKETTFIVVSSIISRSCIAHTLVKCYCLKFFFKIILYYYYIASSYSRVILALGRTPTRWRTTSPLSLTGQKSPQDVCGGQNCCPLDSVTVALTLNA